MAKAKVRDDRRRFGLVFRRFARVATCCQLAVVSACACMGGLRLSVHCDIVNEPLISCDGVVLECRTMPCTARRKGVS